MNQVKPDVKAAFFGALDCRTPEELAGYLDEVCADGAIRSRVEALLRAHREAGNFLGSMTTDNTPMEMADKSISEGPGAIIGPYKLLQEIGEGGFGVVFMAEQIRPVERRVALKIVKPGMDTRQVIARFEAERQALAMMDHPNIAKVLDAGMVGPVCRTGPEVLDDDRQGPARLAGPTGRPYFVMELVKGIPITTYCDEKRLTLRQRLELFITVCQATQHAHQKGIIHRDLKPSNVLVAEYDERPVAKIIDFGVAKAIGQRLTEKTMFTEFGQVIGTVEYMSPEQAKLNQLDIDTRSDIYSLGVLLYELLTGTTPLERKRLHDAAFDEMLRIIREEEPPCPSTRLTTLAQGAFSTVCQRRSVDPRELGERMRGELDWIVMKCLDKDRDRRYETADGLARDVERYMADEPVQACPPSARYRLSKFARRNRAALLTASLVGATLIAGTVVSAWLAVRAMDAERLAEGRLQAELQAHREADDARAKAEASFQKARQAVDDLYTQVAERWLAQQPHMEPIQREFLNKALQFYTESAQGTSAEPAVRFETARAFRRMAEIQHRLGQPQQAEEAFRQAVDRLQAMASETPEEPKYKSELAGTLHQLGVLLGDTGRYNDEEQVHRRALAIEQQLAADSSGNIEYRRALGRAHWYLGQALAHLRRREEAVESFRTALALQRRLAEELPSVAEHQHDLAQTQLRLGLTLGYLGRLDEHREALSDAAAILEILSAEFPTVPAYRNELANAYYWIMRRLPATEADEYLRRALALQEKLVADYPSVADYRYDLARSLKEHGDLLSKSGRTEEAENAFRQAAAVAEKLAVEAPAVHYYRGWQAIVEVAIGDLMAKTERPTQAQAAYQRGIVLLKSLDAEFPNVWQYRPRLKKAYDKLAAVLTAAGQTDEAAAAQREAKRLTSQDDKPLKSEAESNDETDEESPTQAIRGTDRV
jgi:serine/threonine protein kinase/tetratricopeptide (TPR) repeat protein